MTDPTIADLRALIQSGMHVSGLTEAEKEKAYQAFEAFFEGWTADEIGPMFYMLGLDLLSTDRGQIIFAYANDRFLEELKQVRRSQSN